MLYEFIKKRTAQLLINSFKRHRLTETSWNNIVQFKGVFELLLFALKRNLKPVDN